MVDLVGLFITFVASFWAVPIRCDPRVEGFVRAVLHQFADRHLPTQGRFDHRHLQKSNQTHVTVGKCVQH